MIRILIRGSAVVGRRLFTHTLVRCPVCAPSDAQLQQQMAMSVRDDVFSRAGAAQGKRMIQRTIARRHSFNPYSAAAGYLLYFALWFLSFFFLSSFFPRLISAAADWMSTILLHMVWP